MVERIVNFYLAFDLTFYLAVFLTFFLTFYLAVYLASYLAFFVIWPICCCKLLQRPDDHRGRGVDLVQIWCRFGDVGIQILGLCRCEVWTSVHLLFPFLGHLTLHPECYGNTLTITRIGARKTPVSGHIFGQSLWVIWAGNFRQMWFWTRRSSTCSCTNLCRKRRFAQVGHHMTIVPCRSANLSICV